MTCFKCGGQNCGPKCMDEISSLYICECRICRDIHKSLQKLCISCLRGNHKWL